ncbi:hypothetical protein RCH09_002168 [Actimicrobium sp. GrIS 1.19]|uniref:hypothetical protein n=1 Tax=Actimicrobium sp. GrIS 1.19 TaxID=3071708 RepID=UPI002E0369AE|nr:hypothetical protein [Actimicrobium sp. GrIS 1.19]
MKKFILFCATACLLSACGGGGGSGNATTGETSAAAPDDSFVSAIFSLIGSATDDASDQSIDAVGVTTPDNTAPVTIM